MLLLRLQIETFFFNITRITYDIPKCTISTIQVQHSDFERHLCTNNQYMLQVLIYNYRTLENQKSVNYCDQQHWYTCNLHTTLPRSVGKNYCFVHEREYKTLYVIYSYFFQERDRKKIKLWGSFVHLLGCTGVKISFIFFLKLYFFQKMGGKGNSDLLS